MVNFEYYKIFYFVAKNRNMTRAAEQLYMTQPAITKTIQRLEAQLNTKLFVRSKKGVELTEEAEKLFQQLSPACEQILQIEAQAKNAQRNRVEILRISTMDLAMSRFLTAVLMQFREQHPNADISIDRDSPHLKLQYLKDGVCDLVIDYDSLFQDEEQLAQNVNCKVLEHLEDGAFVTGGLKYLAEEEMTFDELGRHTIILPNSDTGAKEYYEKLFWAHGCNNSFVYASGISLRVELAMQNVGILISSKDGMQKYVDQGIFFPLKLRENLMQRKIIMVAKPKEELKPVARAFWDAVSDSFS